MKLSELLTAERILLSIEAADLGAAVRALSDRLLDEGVLEPGAGTALERDLLEGDAGELTRIDEALLLAAVETDAVQGLTGALGVADRPFRVDDPGGRGDPTMGRAVVLLLTPRRLANLRVQAIPTLLRWFRGGDRSRKLLEAARPEEVLELEGIDEVEVHDQLLVEDALTPLQYRIYPDTPIAEVVDLMVRRALHAVPVVGENQEVLGIITSGDALKHLLPMRLTGEEKDTGPSQAREVMSRSVLCVSEDQPLVEAANTMINKDVAQLPVVREGELIGFLTRETVLRQLFGR